MTSGSLVTTFIVEDEPLARHRLRELVRTVPWLGFVGEASNGPAAMSAIDRLRPDLVFLDVRLPRSSGLDVLARLSHKPAVIFTTAHDRFAVSAFELGAIDYLLKPFGRERFRRAAERARAILEKGTDREVPSGAVPAVHTPRLFVREAGRIVPLRVSSIERIQAADDYAIVFAGARQFMLGLTLTELEARLDPDTFLRVHRSHLVNLDHVVECTPRKDSRFDITLRSGATVTASRQCSRIVRATTVRRSHRPLTEN
jgi:two-component system, LytTR family, response regulator